MKKNILSLVALVYSCSLYSQVISFEIDTSSPNQEKTVGVLKVNSSKNIRFPSLTTATTEKKSFSFIIYSLEKLTSTGNYASPDAHLYLNYPPTYYYPSTISKKSYNLNIYFDDNYKIDTGSYRVRFNLLFEKFNKGMKSLKSQWFYFKLPVKIL